MSDPSRQQVHNVSTADAADAAGTCDDAQPLLHAPDLKIENAELRDKLLRALADVENTRRQAERTLADVRQYAILAFAREILPVSDNLQRTIEAAALQNGVNHDGPLLAGVRATEQLLTSTLERFHLRKISALGEVFDPNLHEAMMEVPDPEKPPSTVIAVLQDGYTLNERLVRPASVAVVARRPVHAAAKHAVHKSAANG